MSKTQILFSIQDAYGFSGDNKGFAKYLGISEQRLSNWKSRDTFDHEVLYTKCEALNPGFLLSGTGRVKIDNYPDDVPAAKELGEHDKVFRPKTEKAEVEVRVPLYTIAAAAGLSHLFSETPPTPTDSISIPNLPNCDGAITISGDSMYPHLRGGDIILYKKADALREHFLWGEMYLLSVKVGEDEFITVRYIHKSGLGKEYVKLVSENAHHEPREIRVSDIAALALVKASIRINSML